MTLILKPIEEEELPKQKTSSKKNLNKIPAYGILIIFALLVVEILVIRLFPRLNSLGMFSQLDLLSKIVGILLAISGILIYVFSIWEAIIILKKKTLLNKILACCIFVAIILSYIIQVNFYLTSALYIFSIWASIIILRKRSEKKLPSLKNSKFLDDRMRIYKWVSSHRKGVIVGTVVLLVVIFLASYGRHITQTTSTGSDERNQIEAAWEVPHILDT